MEIIRYSKSLFKLKKMDIKQLIEQKAREYAGIDIDADLGHYQKSHDYEIRSIFYLYRAYKTGMETMLEISNTWIPVENEPIDEIYANVKHRKEWISVIDIRNLGDKGWLDYCRHYGITHWKPITL